MQEWYAGKFAAIWTSGRLSKIALVLDHNLLTHISIESIGQHALKMEYASISHRYFSDENEGLIWLLNSVNS